MPYKNTAIVVTVICWDLTNNTYKTGDSAHFTIRAVGDGTEFTPSSPTPTEIDATNMPGVYSVALTAAENNYSTVTVGGKTSTENCIILPTQWANEVTADVAKIATAAVSVTTAQLGVNVVNIKGTSSVGQAGYAAPDWGHVYAPTSTNNLSATNIATSQAIASVSGAVGSVTGAVTVGAMTDKTGYSISGTKTTLDALNDISVASIFSYVVEGSLTFLNAVRLFMSALFGKTSGGGTASISFRNTTDTKNRIDATVDVDGNRTDITIDGN
jgi:hypothetical protein